MRKEHGFTLIEMMIAVAIAGVLVAVALPNYQSMVKNNCMTTSANSIVSTFQLARSEAIKRGTSVTLTASNAGDNTNEWGTGWSITINEDRNGNGGLDAGEDFDGDGVLDATALLRQVALTCTQTTIDETIDAITNPSDNIDNDSTFIYQSTGAVDDPGTFNICDDRTGENGRQITISATGRPSTNSTFACP
jgi:type IV fimbrial biogenesis protein FimT